MPRIEPRCQDQGIRNGAQRETTVNIHDRVQVTYPNGDTFNGQITNITGTHAETTIAGPQGSLAIVAPGDRYSSDGKGGWLLQMPIS